MTPDASGAINGFIALLEQAKAEIQARLSSLPSRDNAVLYR
ncbi:hypothetical protein [Thiolapillus sp.]